MNRLDYASEIIELAKELGVGGVTPVENILNYCQGKIDGWVESVGGVANIEELEALVARNLQMVFEEINTDDDWERLKDHYARGMREFVFGGIRTRFEDDGNLTYGALVQLAHASATELASTRYRADITAGALKLPESRLIANLLLEQADAVAWKDAIVNKNILQAKSPETARRLTQLIRARLETMERDLWLMVRDGTGTVATHAIFAAAVKHSPLLGDFLEIVVAQQYRLFSKTLTNTMFADYLNGCRERDPDMPQWNESTGKRLRSSVFQMLAQAGYVENTRSLTLQSVHYSDQVLRYLKAHQERYVLKCIQVSP